jgi:hypothetical protein
MATNATAVTRRDIYMVLPLPRLPAAPSRRDPKASGVIDASFIDLPLGAGQLAIDYCGAAAA